MLDYQFALEINLSPLFKFMSSTKEYSTKIFLSLQANYFNIYSEKNAANAL